MTAAAAIPVSVVLADLAAELRRLGGSAEALQDDLSPLLRSAPQAAFEAQGLDRLAQTAHDLAAFAERCAGACPADWRLDPAQAAAPLSLSDVAARLGRTQTAAEAAPAPAGDVEMW